MIQHIAVVTGANCGIGLAIVRQIAQADMKVIATSRAGSASGRFDTGRKVISL